jgi:hypothetical protein
VAAAPAAGRGRWRTPLGYLLTLYAAGVLLVAAFYKAGDPVIFAHQISAHQITPENWSPTLAIFFVAVEFALGAALVACVLPRLALTLNILLMFGFIGVTAWAWTHGQVGDCGCFGRLIERGPREVIVEDLVVILVSLAALALLWRVRTRRRQWLLFAILLLPGAFLTLFGPALPIDGLVVGIGPGSDLSDIALSDLREPADEGRVLLALVAEDCAACERGIGDLKTAVALPEIDRVIAACPGSMATAQAWRLKHLPNFPIGHAPERVLRQYYRRLPVTFLLVDGIVQQVWWNRIPTSAELRAVP